MSFCLKIINSMDQWIFLKKTMVFSEGGQTRNNTIREAQRNECKSFLISLMTKSLFRVSTCNQVPNMDHRCNVNKNKKFVDKGKIITSTVNFIHRWPWADAIEPIDFQSNEQTHDELGTVAEIIQQQAELDVRVSSERIFFKKNWTDLRRYNTKSHANWLFQIKSITTDYNSRNTMPNQRQTKWIQIGHLTKFK